MGDIIPLSPLPIESLNQSASIATTNWYTPNTGQLLRVSWYVQVVQIGTAGTLTVTIGWQDENGAQTNNVVNLMSLLATGYQSGILPIYDIWTATTSYPVTYAATLAGVTGSPLYNLRLGLERIF